MKTYIEFVNAISSAKTEAAKIDIPATPSQAAPSPVPGAPSVMIASPHPDDECIVGALPLRMLHESRIRIIDLAVTLGSNRGRRPGRLRELTAACEVLGFELQLLGKAGLDNINPKSREADKDAWAEAVELARDAIETTRPSAIFLPHAEDWNSTHLGTHHLMMDALRARRNQDAVMLIETEYWGAMDDPNLMVEVPNAILSTQMDALSAHVGEIARNPYHLSLPAWMQDNVRRGGELMGGQGEAAPDLTFATLYKRSRVENGNMTPLPATVLLTNEPASADLTVNGE